MCNYMTNFLNFQITYTKKSFFSSSTSYHYDKPNNKIRHLFEPWDTMLLKYI